jgi:hypothetical protein
VLFTISYLGLGVPAVAAGFAVAKGGGLEATSYEYGVAVIALAALAAVNLIRLRTHNYARAEGPAPLASAPAPQCADARRTRLSRCFVVSTPWKTSP